MIGKYHALYSDKNSDEIIAFLMDWSEEMVDGEVVITSSWAIITGTANIDAEGEAGQTATVWLSGGTPGEKVTVRDTFVTDQGQTLTGDYIITIH